MKIDIFNEVHWQKFRKLPKIAKLSLNEQVQQYHVYVDELQFQRTSYLNWLVGSKAGKRRITADTNAYLLQETDFFILQEDGKQITL
jgi:hypothetical protein